MQPSFSTRNFVKVALIGEALGKDEAEEGLPFVGRAGFKLTRLIEWAGFNRGQFDVFNAAWCRPPNNNLEGTPYEFGAVAHCREKHWDHLLSNYNVLVPMGNVPLHALTGHKGILKARGYIQPGPHATHIIPTVHPSFIQRGQSKYSAAFINDIQKAVLLAERGLPVQPLDYTLDPSPLSALVWAKQYRAALESDPSLRLAYDIETPGKGADEGDLDEDDDPTYQIHRISFAYWEYMALSVPWSAAYIPAIKLLLGSTGEKVVWNLQFDNPRIRFNQVEIAGLVHDGMVAWHILHSDLPKGLGFVATFTCPWQPAWKHLSGSRPAFYNATDSDVELRSFLAIEADLKRTGLWSVYQSDVLDLDPILVHMHQKGMPVDLTIRMDRAVKVDTAIKRTLGEIGEIIPDSLRRYSPPNGYIRTPKDTTGLVTIRVNGASRRCSRCGLDGPKAAHFKTYKRPTPNRPQNPCSGEQVKISSKEVERFATLEPLKISRNLLIGYQNNLNRPIPTKWNKKLQKRTQTMDEKAIKSLMLKFVDDPLYPLVLEYRGMHKIQTSYIGKIVND